MRIDAQQLVERASGHDRGGNQEDTEQAQVPPRSCKCAIEAEQHDAEEDANQAVKGAKVAGQDQVLR